MYCVFSSLEDVPMREPFGYSITLQANVQSAIIILMPLCVVYLKVMTESLSDHHAKEICRLNVDL